MKHVPSKISKTTSPEHKPYIPQIQTMGHSYSESSRTSHADSDTKYLRTKFGQTLEVLRLQTLNPDLPNKPDLNHGTLTLKDFSDHIH